MEFADEADGFRVSGLKTQQGGENVDFALGASDIVLLTLGSLTSGMSYGGNDRPSPMMELRDSAPHVLDAAWKFWDNLATQRPQAFGNPHIFFDRPSKSSWLSFTVTLREPSFFKYVQDWSGTLTGALPLITLKDCPWMISLTVPEQPYFRDQPEGVFVF